MLRRRARVATGPDAEAVRVALDGVEDPELHRPLAELGMVEDVVVARGGAVTVTVRLTTASCPMRDELAARTRTAVLDVPGVSAVDVGFTSMSEAERMAVARTLRAGTGPAGTPLGSGAEGSQGPAVYAVASGKGGVGKSTVTANLATALARQGRRVGVLDADVWGCSVPQLFGVRRAPVALGGLMLPVEAHGVRLMSVGFFVDDDRPVVWRGPMLHKALEQFLSDVSWGELDVLLLDLPPGTGDVSLSLVELCPDAQLLAVTTPQVAASIVAARVGRMAREARMPVAGVVENMATLACACCGHETPLFGEGGGQRLADSLDAPLLARVPLDVALRESGDAGEPVVVRSPDAPSARELTRLASSLPHVRRSLVGRSLPLSVV